MLLLGSSKVRAVLIVGFLPCALFVEGANINRSKRSIGDQKTIATQLKFDTKLRICNAYPYAKDAVQVFDKELAYKGCVELDKEIKAGDQIDFFTRQKEILLGSFEVQEMPQQNSLLLLVIQPHDSSSSGVAFQSHAFASSSDPQLALLDGYVSDESRRNVVDFVDIRDSSDMRSDARKEELRFNSVVAVHPGQYEVALSDKKSAFHKIDARAEQRYSVIRVGVAAGTPPSTSSSPLSLSQQKSGVASSYPEDLIVFPNSGAFGTAVAPMWTSCVIVMAGIMLRKTFF